MLNGFHFDVQNSPLRKRTRYCDGAAREATRIRRVLRGEGLSESLDEYQAVRASIPKIAGQEGNCATKHSCTLY